MLQAKVGDLGSFRRIDEGPLQARAFQVSHQGVVILARNRVKLVIVAAGAGHRQAKKRLAQYVNLVVDPVGLVGANVHG